VCSVTVLGLNKSGHNKRSDGLDQLLKLLTMVIRAQDGSAEFHLKQYNLVPMRAMIFLAGKTTEGLVESNGSLPSGL